MRHVSPGYHEQLNTLAARLCDIKVVDSEPVNDRPDGETDLLAYAELADVVIERPDHVQLGHTAMHGFDRNGEYR